MDSRNPLLRPFKKLKYKLAGDSRKRDRRFGGENDREGRAADVEGSEASQKNSHLHSEVEIVVESGPSREGNNADGKKVCQADPPTSTPSIPHSGKPKSIDTLATPGRVQEGLYSKQSEPNLADENKFGQWKPALSATAKLILRGVKESADVFPPLKSVAGSLCYILENCERTKANTQVVESLAPRVKALSASLCTPVSEGDDKEETRRKELKRKLEKVLREPLWEARALTISTPAQMSQTLI